MVVAGDFGQLPPPGDGSVSLYSNHYSPSVLATTLNGQNWKVTMRIRTRNEGGEVGLYPREDKRVKSGGRGIRTGG